MTTPSDAPQERPTRKPAKMSAQPARPEPTIAEVAADARLESGIQQKEIFTQTSGRGAWQTCYTGLDEIKTLTRRGDQTLSIGEVWRDIRSASFKVFQQLFADRDDVVVPGDHRASAATGAVTLASPREYPALYSVLGCIVDPARVSNAIAVKLQLIPEERRTPKQLIEALSHPGPLTLLKYYWDCSRSLGTRAPGKPNNRIRVIAPATTYMAKVFEPLFARCGVSPSSNQIGSILVTAEQRPGQKLSHAEFFKPLKLQYFSDIYAALRSTYHEAQGYRVEQEQLEALRGRWASFKETDRPLWVTARALQADLDSAATERERARITKDAEARNGEFLRQYLPLLDASIDFFEGSIHVQKQRIHERLVAMRAAFLASPNERINPTNVDLQIDANQVLSALRNDDIRIKGTWNHNDQKQLLTIVKEHTEVFRSLHASVLENAQVLDNHTRLFKGNGLKPWEVPREINRLRAQLKLGTKQLDEVHVKPFIELKDALVEANKQLEKGLNNGDKALAKGALCRMFFVTRAFYVNNSAEIIKLALLQPRDHFIPRLATVKKDLLAAVGRGAAEPPTRADIREGRRTAFTTAGRLEKSQLGAQLNAETDRLLAAIDKIQGDFLALQKDEIDRNAGLPLDTKRTELDKEITATLESFNTLALVREMSAR
jgi:hypothetical protein